jgi:predicted transcriptional regulator
MIEEDNNEVSTQLYLNYPHGDHIYHDPKLAIEGILEGLDAPFDFFNLFFIIGIITIVGVFGLMMSKEEYRSYLKNRLVYYHTEPHRLTMEEVLENEYRTKIIDLIIDDPGIHYRELQRQVNTSASNLTWHLEILVHYKIIHKQIVGKYLIYYPFLDKNPFADLNMNIVKSKTTLNVFQIISDNPGIYQSRIANRLELNHKTIKYHLDKLIVSNLIKVTKKGRKCYYFTKITPTPRNE